MASQIPSRLEPFVLWATTGVEEEQNGPQTALASSVREAHPLAGMKNTDVGGGLAQLH